MPLNRPAPWRRPSGFWTVSSLVVGVLLSLGGVLGFIARYRTPHSDWTIGLAAAVPYLVLGSVVGALLVGLARQWLGLALAMVVAVWGLALQAPLVTSADPPAHAVHLEVLSFNTHLGMADPGSIVRTVRARHVDLLMLEEMLPGASTRVEAAGIDSVLPYHLFSASQAGEDVDLWSRYPLTATRPLGLLSFRLVTATVRVPGVAAPVAVAGVHVSGPVPFAAVWGKDIRNLPAELRRLATTASTVIVAGDFNATRDVAPFRDLLDAGYADADEQAGAGFTPTYPADRWFPPLIAIDHVLTRHAVATSFDTLRLPGSDHRAVLASVAVPPG